MWQAKYEKYKSDGFTMVGIALDVEGAAAARRYYERSGVTFHALVDPNYATGFRAVPYTFFVDEQGVMQDLRGWEKRIPPAAQLKPLTKKLSAQWTRPGVRLGPGGMAALVKRHEDDRRDLAAVVELASRYLALGLGARARGVLEDTVRHHPSRQVARGRDAARRRLLARAHLQLARARAGDRPAQVRHATLSYYLEPSVALGKQIARIIAPEKFDGRPRGDFDNAFREGTLRRLRRERKAWLKAP